MLNLHIELGSGEMVDLLHLAQCVASLAVEHSISLTKPASTITSFDVETRISVTFGINDLDTYEYGMHVHVADDETTARNLDVTGRGCVRLLDFTKSLAELFTKMMTPRHAPEVSP